MRTAAWKLIFKGCSLILHHSANSVLLVQTCGISTELHNVMALETISDISIHFLKQ